MVNAVLIKNSFLINGSKSIDKRLNISIIISCDESRCKLFKNRLNLSENILFTGHA